MAPKHSCCPRCSRCLETTATLMEQRLSAHARERLLKEEVKWMSWRWNIAPAASACVHESGRIRIPGEAKSQLQWKAYEACSCSASTTLVGQPPQPSSSPVDFQVESFNQLVHSSIPRIPCLASNSVKLMRRYVVPMVLFPYDLCFAPCSF